MHSYGHGWITNWAYRVRWWLWPETNKKPHLGTTNGWKGPKVRQTNMWQPISVLMLRAQFLIIRSWLWSWNIKIKSSLHSLAQWHSLQHRGSNQPLYLLHNANHDLHDDHLKVNKGTVNMLHLQDVWTHVWPVEANGDFAPAMLRASIAEQIYGTTAELTISSSLYSNLLMRTLGVHGKSLW